jgi:hypothetical protein
MKKFSQLLLKKMTIARLNNPTNGNTGNGKTAVPQFFLADIPTSYTTPICTTVPAPGR